MESNSEQQQFDSTNESHSPLFNSNDLFVINKTQAELASNKINILTPTFRVWDYTLLQHYGIIIHIIQKLDLLELVNQDKILLFLYKTTQLYNSNNAYHNFNHVVDVCQFLYYLLEKLNCKEYLSKTHILCLIIATLLHDSGHPGLANLYHINAKTNLYKKYKSDSVLELYSCDLAQDTIQQTNILSSKVNQDNMIDRVKLYIMATDMKQHYSIVNEFNSFITKAKDFKEIDGLLFGKCLIHASDLSNTVRPWNISKEWSGLIIYEFFKQGDLERVKKLPISPSMDRFKNSQSSISLKFGAFVVQPIFRDLKLMVIEADLFLSTLEENMELWQPKTPTEELNERKNSLTFIKRDEEILEYSVNLSNHSKNNQDNIYPLNRVKREAEALSSPPSQNSNEFRRISLPAGILVIPSRLARNIRKFEKPLVIHENNISGKYSYNVQERSLTTPSESSTLPNNDTSQQLNIFTRRTSFDHTAHQQVYE